jgi:hypothetical protein
MKESIYEGMERSPKDNFYLYVNYDFHMDMKNGGKKENTAQKIADEMLKVMQDDHSDNHAQQLVQQYYRAFTDGTPETRPVWSRSELLWKISAVFQRLMN